MEPLTTPDETGEHRVLAESTELQVGASPTLDAVTHPLQRLVSGKKRIPVAGPWITEREIEAVAAAARDAWYERAHEFNFAFEQEFALYVGRKHAVALPSCTAGLHLALAALGVGEGDEVIIPDATWIATSAPVSYVGARPVFCDIDESTWCLDAKAFERSISARTRAVIPVDLYGGVPNYDAILEIAKTHGIHVIEDAAEAVGSRYSGRNAGTFGAASVFSFHGSKTLTTGEGGMIVTDDDDLVQRIYFLRDHGRPPFDREFFNTEVAFKYRMSSVQAALGLAQLRRVDELVAKKRSIFGWYSSRLGHEDGIALNAEPPGTTNSYWMSTVVLDPRLGVTAKQLRAALDERGIDTRPFFHPLSSLPAYASTAALASTSNPIAYRIAPYGVNLPSALSLTEEDVDLVCTAVKQILAAAPTIVG